MKNESLEWNLTSEKMCIKTWVMSQTTCEKHGVEQVEMFPGDRGTGLEGGNLRSGRRFRSEKRRRTVTRRGSCGTTRGEYYELKSHFDEIFIDEEEEYQPISEKEEEEESNYPEYEYNKPTTPRTSLGVRSRN